MIRCVALLSAVMLASACGKSEKAGREAAGERPDPVREAAQEPPPKREPMRVTRMASNGFLRITEKGVDREEALPESPLKHGEFPEACWVAPDGTVYAVGKQYTGVPGPDFGVVWRRAPDGAWSTAFRLKDRTFHSITGRSANEIVVGTLKGFVAFDGTTWTVHDVPVPMLNVWSDGKVLLAQDFDDTKTFKLAGGKATEIAHRPHDAYEDRYACARGKTKYRVFEKSTEIGEEDLSPEEEAEIRGELDEIEAHPERIRPVKP